MSTDQDYADFLARSQKRYDGGHATTSTVDPQRQAVTSQMLTSESDEPFYPVSIDMSLGVDFAQ